ncbi:MULTISPECIES: DUF4823 domain-containing protein [Aeromonas]|uniref:DUF4823 domain-containing protein n=1 Tax=Aeromonas TaxID=642 RepID=UPI0009BECEB7|nr:DUF4823 domain-containing protein [Aeromonas dhakensis]MBL0657621.1 DUF4823 domain-containing protein [Aeromonas dhakensis]MBQ4681764.1 DUF4823 domain-containing protein [Aeromonas dhakensis]MDX7833365.1 DUF4823 domain-containing protein [Aeromonas dhakensis]MED7771777.1 DUF4823 domain-containing protein [Aeromonas dhakensis]HDX8437963.1 DUF4823 domain-containing protein [Aeromonas dhakensis]
MKNYVTALLSLLAVGCSSTYQQSNVQTMTSKLDPSQGVLISQPQDGSYETTQYQNSGKMTAQAIYAAFSKKAHRVEITTRCHGEPCLNDIQPTQFRYYVKPVILHWEERATEWSGKPDVIEIQLVIYDTLSKKSIANSSFKGKSKWATFGGDHPQDLLPEPTEKYVNSLY